MSPRSQQDPERHPHRSGARGAAGRLVDAWGEMHADQRLAAAAALGLFVTMLLPWYTKTDDIVVKGVPHPTQSTFSAFGAFSFVEAAVLLVSVFVLAVLFARAEGRAFHLPGGDGTIIMLAGAWAAILIFYRLFAKPTLQHTSLITATEGVTWGIFFALLVALALSYAGWRMRLAARPEPPLVAPERDRPPERRAQPEAPPPAPGSDEFGPEDAPATRIRPRGQRPRYPAPPAAAEDPPPPRRSVTREDAAQLSFDDPPVGEPFADDPPVARRPR